VLRSPIVRTRAQALVEADFAEAAFTERGSGAAIVAGLSAAERDGLAQVLGVLVGARQGDPDGVLQAVQAGVADGMVEAGTQAGVIAGDGPGTARQSALG
jgi:hypothetical protein